MKILYLAFTDLDVSINHIYISGLKQNQVEIAAFSSKRPRWRKYWDMWKFYRQNRQGAQAIIVGYDSPELVVFMKLVSGKKIIYNALCSVYERLIISRDLAGAWSIKAFYYWLSDFLACRFADLVMLESVPQIEFFRKFVWLAKRKAFLAYTGVDERNYFFDPAVKKLEQFTVMFRGQFVPESGAEVAVQAAKLLEGQGINFIMHCFGSNFAKLENLIAELKPANFKLVSEFLPFDVLRRQMQECHLNLGQLSVHDRLKRTIPHKAYESLAMKVPYLTARNPGIMSLLKEGETCLAFEPANATELARQILWAKNHPEELARIAENGYRLYETELTSRHLAAKLLKAI